MFGIWFILVITVVIVIYFVLRRQFNENIAYMAVSIREINFGAFVAAH